MALSVPGGSRRVPIIRYSGRVDGPIYRLAGRRAVYADPDLDAWARSRISGPMQKPSGAVESQAV
jgi:hypothetical protein